MPSQKDKSKKVKSETAAIAASTPVPIKAEPLDIKPLSAFVDDRVELIRQAFTCLKPKEVKCLVPDFLQGKSIDYIQEQCLDELLGISTKRLLAIINNTKCPTDTESSSDEDEKVIEHISLDEISSDSEVEIAKPATKNKSKDSKLKRNKTDTKSNEKPNKNGDKKSEKEMTVLELLELQARARAIRSQLALEPVTKIELDSDHDHASDTEREPPKATEKANKKSKLNNTSSAGPSGDSQPKEQSKRVRLKRNFRIRQVGDEEPPEETSQSSIPEQPPARKSRSKSKEKNEMPEKIPDALQQGKPEDNAQAPKSRDSSPEVIPVIPSPETLCISSDSEDEKAKKAKSSIFVDNIEELDKQLKEKQVQTPSSKPDHKDEPEEGELTEEDKSPSRNRKESIKSNSKETEQSGVNSSPKVLHPVDNLQQDEELDYEIKEISDSEPESNTQFDSSAKTDKNEAETSAAGDKSEGESENASSNDDDNEKSSSDDEDDEDDHDPDVVEIHDSSDETLLEQKMGADEPEKSWGSRWLQSKRVAKVMAASRLGNKVRDKLKEKKKQKQQQEQDEEEARKAESPPPPKEPEAPSNVEVGSVEHYKELASKVGEPASTDKMDAEVSEQPDEAGDKQ